MRPSLPRASYLQWIVVPVALFAVHHLYGLPHAIWSYAFYGSRTDFAARHYTRCTFIGPYGVFTTPATDGKCGWIVFRKAPEAGQ